MEDHAGNYDEIFENLDRMMEEADKKTKSWQALIRPGEYFVRATQLGFKIYGEVLKDPPDCKRDEYTENYRFCRAYSVACPNGELGDVHVSTIERIISKDEFEAVKRRNWNA